MEIRNLGISPATSHSIASDIGAKRLSWTRPYLICQKHVVLHAQFFWMGITFQLLKNPRPPQKWIPRSASTKNRIFLFFAIFAFPLGTVWKPWISYASNKRNTLRFKGRNCIFLKITQVFIWKIEKWKSAILSQAREAYRLFLSPFGELAFASWANWTR